MNEQFEFKIDYKFATLEIQLPTEVLKDQFLFFLEGGDRLSRINGDKLAEKSTSQWETISEIKEWCKGRNISCELNNKTLWAKIMNFIDSKIKQAKEEADYEYNDR